MLTVAVAVLGLIGAVCLDRAGKAYPHPTWDGDTPAEKTWQRQRLAFRVVGYVALLAIVVVAIK